MTNEDKKEMTFEEKISQPHAIAIFILLFVGIVLFALKLGKQKSVEEWNWVEILFPIWTPIAVVLTSLISAYFIREAEKA